MGLRNHRYHSAKTRWRNKNRGSDSYGSGGSAGIDSGYKIFDFLTAVGVVAALLSDEPQLVLFPLMFCVMFSAFLTFFDYAKFKTRLVVVSSVFVISFIFSWISAEVDKNVNRRMYQKTTPTITKGLDPVQVPKTISQLKQDSNLGDAESQVKLAKKYYTGDEISKNTNVAIFWFKQAASKGNYEAVNFLNQIGESK